MLLNYFKTVFAIVVCVLSLKLCANDLLRVEDYKLDNGRYEGQLYTGYINIDGLPIGQGIVMCKDFPDKVEYDAQFKNGVAISGKVNKCENYLARYKKFGEYNLHYEGPLGNVKDEDKQLYMNNYRMELTFLHSTILDRLEGTYIYPAKGEHSIKGVMIFKKGGKLKNIIGEFVIPSIVIKNGLFSYESEDHKFVGIIKDGYDVPWPNNGDIEGVITWNDGVSYKYKGKWDFEKISNLKKRLDIVSSNKKN